MDDGQGFDVCVGFDPGHTHQAAVAALLGAGNGAVPRGSAAIAVDVEAGCLDSLGEAHGTAVVVGIHRAAEAVDAVIGHGKGFFFRVEFLDTDDGPEDLFLGNAHFVVHIDEDGGFHVKALVQRSFGDAVTAAGQRGAFLLADLDIPEDAVQLCLGDDRAHFGFGILGQADADLLHPGNQCFTELVVNGVLDQQPGGGDAKLAGGREVGGHDVVDGGFPVGVLEDDAG